VCEFSVIHFLNHFNCAILLHFSCGVLAFGLSSPRTLAIWCGVLVAAWGPAQILVYLKVFFGSFILLFQFLFYCLQFPQYFDHKEKYNPEAEV
jgi:hypothetical protein